MLLEERLAGVTVPVILRGDHYATDDGFIPPNAWVSWDKKRGRESINMSSWEFAKETEQLETVELMDKNQRERERERNNEPARKLRG